MFLQKSSSFELLFNRQSRLESLDVLRGIALCGVFITHFICQFYGLAFTPIIEKAILSTPFDAIADKILGFLLFDKPRGMFSFLFGVGFYYQLNKLSRSENPSNISFVKRLTILFLFGLLHSAFFFQGDVLRYYAVLGILLLFSVKLKPPFLLAGAFLFAVVVPSICTFFPNDLFIGNFNTPVAFTIFGQFLLGFWTARKKVFENLSGYTLMLKRIFWVCLVISGCLLSTREIGQYAIGNNLLTGSELLHNILDLTFVVGIQVMILLFISGVLLVYLSERWKSALRIFIPAGQMTLTNYIAQSVIAILLFKIGFYQLLGTVASFVVCLCLCSMQLYFSRWWLTYYKSGPLEWIWRSLASMNWQPERRALPIADTTLAMKNDADKSVMQPAMNASLTG